MEDSKVLEQRMKSGRPVAENIGIPTWQPRTAESADATKEEPAQWDAANQVPEAAAQPEALPSAAPTTKKSDEVILGIATALQPLFDTAAEERAYLRMSLDSLTEDVSRLAKQQEPKKYPAAEARLETLEKSYTELKDSNMRALRQMLEFKQESGRRMNDELDKYHKMFENSVHDPIWKELGAIYQSVQRIFDKCTDPRLKKDLEWDVLEPMQELMEDYGIAVLVSEVGSKRSLRSTHSVRQIPTADESQNGNVARSVAPGFARDGFILVREDVESYVFKAELKAAQEQAEAERVSEEDEPPVEENPAAETGTAVASEYSAATEGSGVSEALPGAETDNS